MADFGHWKSRNLRDIINSLDSLRRMIRELKRGRRRLRFQIQEAIKILEENKRMRDELNQLSSTIGNFTHIEAMQPQGNTSENVLSHEDFMDPEDENMIPTTNSCSEVSYNINIQINNSAMSTESFHSPLESVCSMASADSSEENLDSEMESLDSSEGKFNSSIHFTYSSEDEFLDADNGSECFSHSSVHSFSERNFSGNSQEQPLTIYTTDKNSEPLQREKASSSKEDVICMWTNECKKRIISVPKEINIFENLQAEIKAGIISAVLTDSNSQHPEREEFEGKRKYSRSSSISSNRNFSDDSFKETKYSTTGPIEWCHNETVTNEYSKSSTSKQFTYTDESVSEINSYTCANFSRNFPTDVIPCQNNQNITDDSSKQVEKDNFTFGGNSCIISPTSSKMNFPEKFSVDRDVGDNSKSPTWNKLCCKNESFNELGINFCTNTNFSESSLIDKTFGRNNDKMRDNCSKRLQIEDLGNIQKNFNDSSLSQTVTFSENASEKTNLSKDVETNNSKTFESKDFSDRKFDLSSKDEKLDYEEVNFNHSKIDSYAHINTHKSSCANQEESMIEVMKMEGEISTPLLIGNELYLEKEKFSDIWTNSFNEKISPEYNQNHMNKLASQMQTENFLKLQNNLVKNDNELNDDVSNFDSLINYSGNCPTEMVYSVNISNSLKTNYEEPFDKKVEQLEDWTNNHPDTCSTNNYHNMKFHKSTAATSNDDLYSVEREEFCDIYKRLVEHEIHSFPETDDWTENREKTENLSELSVNDFHSTEENLQNFGDKIALTKSLESDSLLEITSVNASHDDISLTFNGSTSLSEDCVKKDTACLDAISENPQPVRNMDIKEKSPLKKDITE